MAQSSAPSRSGRELPRLELQAPPGSRRSSSERDQSVPQADTDSAAVTNLSEVSSRYEMVQGSGVARIAVPLAANVPRVSSTTAISRAGAAAPCHISTD